MREKLIELLEKSLNYDGTGREMRFAGCDVTLADQVASSSKYLASSEWIPVTERLPEKYGKYLCRYVFNESAEYPHIEAISYYPTMTRFQGEGSCGMRVTHWMPLPEPPKGE